jgi:hypothetical protein
MGLCQREDERLGHHCTYPLDELEYQDTNEREKLGLSLMNRVDFFRKSAIEGNGRAESTSNEENIHQREPKMGIFGAERIFTKFAVVLGNNLDNGQNSFREGILKTTAPGSLQQN